MNEESRYFRSPHAAVPAARVGPFVATLLNGIFGDPLLHIRIAHERRSMVVDIGEGRRLPARLAHQVSDLFISHAHVDHVAGFVPFLRARIGLHGLCRVYGPPGLAQNIAGFIAGIHWDRAGPRAPKFEVAELHDGRIVRFHVAAGNSGARELGGTAAPEGLLLDEPAIRVRSCMLDHLTPVLAFSFESKASIKIRKERLLAKGLVPGPWLNDLKRRVARGDRDSSLELPDGSARSVAELAEELVIVKAGQKLVYATDLADTRENRERLTALAAGAHTFFCEAVFCDSEASRARRSGHLTARACGEIAAAARVHRIVPFHFSKRYESDPARVYHELIEASSRISQGTKQPMPEVVTVVSRGAMAAP